MVKKDTIQLLRECDAGLKMGVASIDEVRDYAQNGSLKAALTECKRQHESLKDELQQALDRFGDDGKAPNPMAKGMSWIKTEASLVLDNSDSTVANLVTDGCNMGIKTLRQSLNDYPDAGQNVKDLANRIITEEKNLVNTVSVFL